MNLHDYDIVVVNSSGGKDSLVAVWDICRQAKKQKYPLEKIVISHQELGESEWMGTSELVKQQADLFGLKVYYSRRKNEKGHEETLLEYALRRGKWPSNKQRWCTSDFKRGPGARVITQLTKGMKNCKVLHVFGFRADESPARKKKEIFCLNKNLSTKSRQVFDYLPVHSWNTRKVWKVIRLFKLPSHFAYDLGMPRLSCVFCIFSPFDALVIAGYHNYQLLLKYLDVEKRIGHLFRENCSLQSVKDAIDGGYKPQQIKDWVM